MACVVKEAGGKVTPIPEGLLSSPSRSDEQVQWGKDGTLRVLHHGTVNVAQSLIFDNDGRYSVPGRTNDRSYVSHLRCICGPRHLGDWI